MYIYMFLYILMSLSLSLFIYIYIYMYISAMIFLNSFLETIVWPYAPDTHTDRARIFLASRVAPYSLIFLIQSDNRYVHSSADRK